jgi:hypothetical protein
MWLGGGGEFLLINEIGNYSGKVAAADATAGRYRARITADGSWVLRFQQPVPGGRAKSLPGTFRGRGANVLRIRSTEDLQPIVTARHRGQANFIVEAIGYGDVEGSILLFNEIATSRARRWPRKCPLAITCSPCKRTARGRSDSRPSVTSYALVSVEIQGVIEFFIQREDAASRNLEQALYRDERIDGVDAGAVDAETASDDEVARPIASAENVAAAISV